MIRFGSTKRTIIASVIALIIWTFVSVNTAVFDVEEKGFEYFNYIFSYVMTAGIWALIALKFDFSGKVYKIISLAVFLLAPFFAMRISMIFVTENLMGIIVYAANVGVYYMIMAAFLTLFRNMKWAGIATIIFSYLFNLATFIVNMFRGIPIVPSDILAIETAMNVAGNYSFEWQPQIVFAAVMMFFSIALLCKFSFKPNIPHRHLFMAGGGAVFCAAVFAAFSLYPFSGISYGGFSQEYYNSANGVALNFILNLRSLKLEKPENYNEDEVKYTLAQETEETGFDGRKPNVLVIMNESFADLKVLGDFQTNKEYLSFFNSLKRNTVKGELLVSPFGGNTCNSEFEFLTGMSMELFPANSIPYQQYISADYPHALPGYFKRLGYQTVALHPYYGNGWNRPNVYGFMKFDNFVNMDNMNKYQNADEFEFMRGYMSDRTSYSAVINQFENKDPGSSMFLFNVTMQNHGGFGGEYGDFTPDVEITNMSSKYKGAEEYLSLMRHSDKALDDLINYFYVWDEPIIILIFGDHQPAVEGEFFTELLGKSSDELTDEELLAKYKVPFMIWANFDIEEETGVETSTNYLSNILLEKAGLPKSAVNLFLDEVEAQIPRINAMGYFDTDGYWHESGTEQPPILSRYKNMAYYMLKHKTEE